MKRLALITTLVGIWALTSSCAPKKDAGAFIAISASPEKPAIVPGAGASCVAAAAAKKTSTASTPDVQGSRILYTNFRLQWRSKDSLTISAMRATVSGAGIDAVDGQVIDIAEEEIRALIGLPDSTVPSSVDDGRVFESNSNDTSKTKTTSSPYAPCGLHLGGIKLKTGVTSFSASVKLEIFGYSTAADGTQQPVRQKTTLKAETY